MIAGPLLVMLTATENPVPQSLFTVYVTWHTDDAAAGAACWPAAPVAADAPMTPAATRVPAASEQTAAQTAAERPGDRFINTRIRFLLARGVSTRSLKTGVGRGREALSGGPALIMRLKKGQDNSADDAALAGAGHERFTEVWVADRDVATG